MPVIYSRLSNDRTFPNYIPKKGDDKTVSRSRYGSAILVKGGANVSDKNRVTPEYVETNVTAEDLKILQDNATFKRLVDRGWLSLSKPKEAKKDAAAPKTEKELKDKAAKKGVEVKLNTDEE